MLRKTVIAALLLLVVHSTSAQTAVPGSYRIDPAVSHIHWRIYRAGLLGGLGHNHVISAHNIRGSVEVATPLRQSEFQLEIPVAALELDNPELRSRYGKAFAGAISAEDIAATRENMLGASVLSAAGFPRIRVRGSPLSDSGDTQIQITILLRGHSVSTTVPARLHFSADSVTASGDFSLTHRQLGLTPFSVFARALRVEERIDFSFHVTASRY